MKELTLTQLARQYGVHRVVDGLDLTLPAGEFVSLLGPSGCGKTTTLRMIAGFVTPSEGTIAVDGRVLSSAAGAVAPEHRGMSMIFQSYAIWPNMTVFENVAFGLRARRIQRDEVSRRVGEILEVVRLSSLAERYPSELSGGQQQRVALARAVVVRPDVLLLDEPLSNLDANLREDMRVEIRRLHDTFRMTSIYVTHDQAEAMATSDRIAVMNAGRIEQIADPVTLYTRPLTRFVATFIGRTNLLSGRTESGRIAFGGFAVAADRLPGPSEAGTYSLRPQAIAIRASKEDRSGDDTLAPACGARVDVPATIRQRTFLGESWDYLAELDAGAPPLRVSAPAEARFAVGESVVLSIDAARITPVT